MNLQELYEKLGEMTEEQRRQSDAMICRDEDWPIRIDEIGVCEEDYIRGDYGAEPRSVHMESHHGQPNDEKTCTCGVVFPKGYITMHGESTKPKQMPKPWGRPPASPTYTRLGG